MDALISQTLTKLEVLPEAEQDQLFKDFAEQVEKALVLRMLKQADAEGGEIPVDKAFANS